MRVTFCLLLALGGCVRWDPEICADGMACASGTVCVTVQGTSGPQDHCLDRSQLCDPAMPQCTLENGTIGSCLEGGCLPMGCGNLRLDPGEACDDGNQAPGDGCSGDCRSTEVCSNGQIDPINGEECDDGNGFSHDGCTSTCQRETPRWTELGIGYPARRAGQAMAFDAARGEAVMFGGVGDLGFDDTWTWDGSGWHERHPISNPSARTAHVMAYDASRQRVVLFGGSGTVHTLDDLGDTWEWDGTSWTIRQPMASPPVRYAAALAYDARRRRTVLFGGRSGLAVAMKVDTWEWDGTTWTRGPDGPSRSGHAMAYDAVRGVIVLFGGQSGNLGQPSNETWTYDGSRWSLVDVSAPPTARKRASLAFVPSLGRVVLTGGVDAVDQPLDDTWSWDGQAWTRLTSLPFGISATAMATDLERDDIVMFGGAADVGSIDTTLAWNQDWRIVEAKPIDPSSRIASAFDTVRRAVVVVETTDVKARTWELRDAWRLCPDGSATLPSRTFHALAYDEARQVTVLFGGLDPVGGMPLDDTWTWNGTDWMPTTPLARPPARSLHALAPDDARGRVVLFGGIGSTSKLDDTWLWDGATWTRAMPAHAPSPRSAHAMAYDPIRRRVVLFGGSAEFGTTLGDTWEWDGTDWTEIHALSSPTPRSDAALAWNPDRRRLVLAAGNSSGSYLADAFEWDGVTWSPISVESGPSRRDRHVLATDPAGTGVVLFGGEFTSVVMSTDFGDTWRLRWSGTGAEPRCGHDGTGCASLECWPVCAPACSPGLICDPALPHCGDGACGAVEDCFTCPADCGACPTTCGDARCDPGETCAADCP